MGSLGMAASGRNNSSSKATARLPLCSEVEDGSSCRANQPGVSDAFLAGPLSLARVSSLHAYHRLKQRR